MKNASDSYEGDSPLMAELDAICEGKSKLDLAGEIWKLRRSGPKCGPWSSLPPLERIAYNQGYEDGVRGVHSEHSATERIRS